MRWRPLTTRLSVIRQEWSGELANSLWPAWSHATPAAEPPAWERSLVLLLAGALLFVAGWITRGVAPECRRSTPDADNDGAGAIPKRVPRTTGDDTRTSR